MEIKDSPAIVTGAASGLGAATAKALAEQGAKVTLLDLQDNAVKAHAESIGGLGIACDVSSADSVEQAVAAAREAHGPTRLLVNCAGTGVAEPTVGPDGPQPLESFAHVVAVNLTGTFNTIRLVAADLMTQEPLDDGSRGVVINVASGAAFDGVPGAVAYSASKGGILSMTLALAREFGDVGIRVMTISPGAMHTPMIENLPAPIHDEIARLTPFPKRMAEPPEFAKLVIHIAENTFLNGEVIRFDGGNRMPYKFRSQEDGGISWD